MSSGTALPSPEESKITCQKQSSSFLEQKQSCVTEMVMEDMISFDCFCQLLPQLFQMDIPLPTLPCKLVVLFFSLEIMVITKEAHS